MTEQDARDEQDWDMARLASGLLSPAEREEVEHEARQGQRDRDPSSTD